MKRKLEKLLFFLIIFISIHAHAQHADVDITACTGMEKILSKMKAGAPKEQVSSMIDSILITRPYKIMFEHYNRFWRPNHLPPDVFKRMILSLQFKDEYKRGENQRADQMLIRWEKYYNNFALYQKNLRQLQETNLDKFINEGVQFAQSWLPHDWQIPDFYFPIIPNGGSSAFTINNSQGYDFFQLPKDSTGQIVWDELLGTISHESHHLGNHYAQLENVSSRDSLAYQFLAMFIGEGTATKFINNYPGGKVPSIDKSRKTTIFSNEVKQWWDKYTADEQNMFNKLETSFEKIYDGSTSKTDLLKEASNFWLAGFTSPIYFVGSELFGAIYTAFGKEKAFEAMKDPRKIFKYYNDAIKAKPEILGGCLIISDSIAQHALEIGKNKNRQ